MRSFKYHRQLKIYKVQGFSIIEVLVGMLIGLIVVLVTGQVLSMNYTQSNTTATTTDSMVNGSLALHEITREGARSGFGISAVPELYGCTVVRRKASAVAADIRVDTFTLAPVVIEDGASGAPDTIILTSSHSKGLAIPTYLGAEYKNANTPPFSKEIDVISTLGINVGDMLLIGPPVPTQLTPTEIADLKTAFQAAVPTIPASLQYSANPNKTWCSLFQATGDNTSTIQGAIYRISDTNPPNKLRTVQSNGHYLINRYQGAADYDGTIPKENRTSPFNDIPFPEPSSAYHYPVDSVVFNLGSGGLQSYTFSISNGDKLESNNEKIPVYSQIVQLQAQYGKDTNADGTVDAWDNTTPTTNAGWREILSIRVAVVARSVQREGGIATSNAEDCPSINSVCWAGNVKITNLNADNAGSSDWQHYRYRVFETIIPLRNSIWNMGTTGS